MVVGIPLVALAFAGGYYWVAFGSLIDQQLHGERQRVFPQIYARPFELHLGQALTDRQLIDQLNELGYAERPHPDKPGEFSQDNGRVSIAPRAEELKGRTVTVSFQKPTAPTKASGKPGAKPAPLKAADHVESLEIGKASSDQITLETPLLSSIQSERSKRRPVGLSTLPPHVIRAVLAIEDRRY